MQNEQAGNPEEPFRGYSILRAMVGRKYAECEFRNFDIGNDEHRSKRQKALRVAVDYAKNLAKYVDQGRSIVFTGTCGTGKDHLAVAVLRVALGLELRCRYLSGARLVETMRQHYLELHTAVPPNLVEQDLLFVSDIEPEAGSTSDFEEKALLQLVDARYRECRPFVVTTNLPSRKEMEKVIGLRTVDRLLENCELVPMIWPTHREEVRRG